VCVGLKAGKHSGEVFGVACDVTRAEQVDGLWHAGKHHLGNVDIWINNAGIAHPQRSIAEMEPAEIDSVIGTNIIGAWNGCQIALQGMQAQGFGFIYNMEGLGSDGRHIQGLGLYGSTKSAMAYLTQSLVRELKSAKVKAGSLRPGMVMTDMITRQYEHKPEDWQRAQRIFNILADQPEMVTPWMVDRILRDNPNGVKIHWLTRRKVLWRFMTASITKRNIFKGEL
jgi:NAD(P)-dependent dehydrogenase (short-subunit alcohol dehydrogenase family)